MKIESRYEEDGTTSPVPVSELGEDSDDSNVRVEEKAPMIDLGSNHEPNEKADSSVMQLEAVNEPVGDLKFSMDDSFRPQGDESPLIDESLLIDLGPSERAASPNVDQGELEVSSSKTSRNFPADTAGTQDSAFEIDHVSYDEALEQLIDMPRGAESSTVPSILAHDASSLSQSYQVQEKEMQAAELSPVGQAPGTTLSEEAVPKEAHPAELSPVRQSLSKPAFTLEPAPKEAHPAELSPVRQSLSKPAVALEPAPKEAHPGDLSPVRESLSKPVFALEQESQAKEVMLIDLGDSQPKLKELPMVVEEKKKDEMKLAEEKPVVFVREKPPRPLVETHQQSDLSLLTFHESSQSMREPMRAPVTDAIELLPPVERYQRPARPAFDGQQNRVFLHQPLQPQNSFGHLNSVQNPAMMPVLAPQISSGRRKIRLRLKQDMRHSFLSGRGFLGHFRQRSRNMFSHAEDMHDEFIDRGRITVSWYEGTSSAELQQHVRKSTLRKLKLDDHIDLTDLRFVDETSDPPEEIVLSTYIPDGSNFVLQFCLTDTSTDSRIHAPESPSAAPSPHPDHPLGGLNAKQLALLKMPAHRRNKGGKRKTPNQAAEVVKRQNDLSTSQEDGKGKSSSSEGGDDDSNSNNSKTDRSFDDEMALQSEDPIEARLRQITELLVNDRERKVIDSTPSREKRQVVFVLANYFVLFLSLIAISAEIQARAPDWLNSLEMQMKNVQDCASDNEALFQCVANGEFAGLVASVTIWLTRSVATSRILLFGFETPQKLWTVVYESLVTAFCWGVSYLFIRRAMNPDTRSRFLHKYWKDAVYGSLAGFNAAFLKHVLKNLIPQEAVEDVLRERQLKILNWLPSFN